MSGIALTGGLPHATSAAVVLNSAEQDRQDARAAGSHRPDEGSQSSRGSLIHLAIERLT